MKKIIVLSLLFILIISAVSAIVVRVYPYHMSQGTATMKIVVLNHGTTMNDAKISVSLPELSLEQHIQMDLKSNKAAKAYVDFDLPKDAKGYYPVRITVADKKGVQKKTHTWVLIE